MGYFILPINDIFINSKDKIDAVTIVNTLIKEKIWLFKKGAKYTKRFKVNDILLIYICGVNRRYVHSEMKLISDLKLFDNHAENIAKDLNIDRMTIYAEIETLRVFDPPIKLMPRRDISSISEDDYNLIVKQC